MQVSERKLFKGVDDTFTNGSQENLATVCDGTQERK